MIGAGLAGPRRIKAGGARDHLLGAHAVSGFGDSFKTGGRVVKNVTGYDLCKLLAGSWGTLAVMTEVTLKVMPKPESERTLVLRGLDDVDRQPGDDRSARFALRRFGRGASAGFGVRRRDRRAGAPRVAGAGGDAAAAGRHRGFGGAPRRLRSASCWRHSARRRRCEDDASAAVWAAVRDVNPFAADGALGAWPVWRIVCPPAVGRRARPGAGARDRRRSDLRLGRRPDLGGAAAAAGRAGRSDASAASRRPAAMRP